ncbi:MAG: hypothetical protein HND27_03790 [Bacteroidetes bacterium]|nr:hypothetical protein [Bacteroidota bacterium]
MPTQQSHTLAGCSILPSDQSHPKSVPAQPGKRNFQKCPTHDKKEKDKVL